jgi:tetratricopeptide (TPR) repeat protein
MRLFPIGAISLLLTLPVAAQQQDSSSQQSSSQSGSQQQGNTTPQQQNPPASAKKPAPPQKKPSEAEQNPFPEAQSEAAAHQTQQPADDATPSAPAPQTAPAASGKGSEAGKNPFSESQSEKAAQPSQPKPAPPQSDTPDANSSSSRTGLKDLGLPDENGASDTKEFSPGPNPALATKDTQVGMFYLKTGDYKGAYDRFAEASKVDPGNADAVFGLAESARKLNHRDEAARNYRLYLAAVPDGPHAKEARKALKDLGVGSGS